MGRRASVQCRDAHRQRGQSGNSLIEVIIAILLLAGIFVILAGAVLTVVKSTATNERVQGIDAALVTYGEILQTQVPYSDCNSSISSTYQAAAEDPTIITGGGEPGGSESWRRNNFMVTEVIGVESWNPDTGQFEDRAAALYKCVSPDSGAQRVTYKVTQCPDAAAVYPCAGSPVREGQIVKRKQGPS